MGNFVVITDCIHCGFHGYLKNGALACGYLCKSTILKEIPAAENNFPIPDWCPKLKVDALPCKEDCIFRDPGVKKCHADGCIRCAEDLYRPREGSSLRWGDENKDEECKMPKKVWTEKELETLEKIYPKMSNADIAEKLGKTVAQVGQKAHHLQLTKDPEFRDKQRRAKKQ